MNKNYNRIMPVIAAIAIQLCLGNSLHMELFQAGIAEGLFSGNNQMQLFHFILIGHAKVSAAQSEVSAGQSGFKDYSKS